LADGLKGPKREKMKKYFISMLCLMTLASCGGGNYQQVSTAPKLTPAEKLADTYVEAVKVANQKTKQCSDSIQATDEAKLVHKEVLFAGQKDPNAKDLMLSKQRLNSKQSAALQKFMIEQKSCRSIRLNALDKTPYLPSVWLDFYKKSDDLGAQLLNKKITIGEANQQWMTILQETNVNLNEAKRKIYNDVMAMREKEVDLDLKQRGVAAQQAQAQAAREANNRQAWKDSWWNKGPIN
jgi:hypothetical protein